MFTANMNSERRHQYNALDAGQIRVLILAPSHDADAPLCLSFHSAPLNDLAGRYEALSYVWGEPRLEFLIHHHDESQVWVTRNLDSALRRLRLRHDARWIWADAVCINQEDSVEKGVQVQLMGQIFREAKQVMAWLGSGGGKEEEGMRILAASSRGPRYADLAFPVDSARGFSLLSAFFNLQWFKRLWIVQECVLNADIILIYGASELSMVRLVAGLRLFLQDEYSPMEADDLAIRSIATKADLWRSLSMIEPMSAQVRIARPSCDILDLVARFVDHDCSNAHDRIFALYGLASKISPTARKQDGTILPRHVYMDVNYSTSVLQSYTNFAVACMESGAVAQVLNAALVRQTDQDSADWPSWVPDWRRNAVTQPTLALLEPSDSIRGGNDVRRRFFTSMRTPSSTIMALRIWRALPVHDPTDPEEDLYIDRVFSADSMEDLVAAFFKMLEGIRNDSYELLEVLRRMLDLPEPGPTSSRYLAQRYMRDDPARPKFPNPNFNVDIDTRNELKQEVFRAEVLAVMKHKTFFTAKVQKTSNRRVDVRRQRDWYFGAGTSGLRSDDRLFHFKLDRTMDATVHKQDPNFLRHKRPTGAIHESIALALRPSTEEATALSQSVPRRYRLCGGGFLYRYQDPTLKQTEKEYVTTIELE